MKICQIVASSGAGGLEKHVQDLSSELAKTHEVTLIAPKGMQSYVSEHVNFVAMDFKRSRHNPLLLWDLLKFLRQGNFDIVHAQANKAVSILAKLRWYFPGKTVGTIHNSRRNKGGVFSNISHVIAVSREAATEVVGKVPVSIIYNGIKPNKDLKGYSKTDLCNLFHFDPDKPLLCAVGRLVDAKGFDLLIAAIQDLDINLMIVGEGKLRPSLQTSIEQNQFTDRVKMVGHRNDVNEILKGVDGMIISSRNEGFSYVFVEALHARTPVLATDVSAKEFLPETLIMEKTIDSINNKMKEYVFDLAKWREQMEDAFLRAEQELSLEAMTANTVDVYRKALSE